MQITALSTDSVRCNALAFTLLVRSATGATSTTTAESKSDSTCCSNMEEDVCLVAGVQDGKSATAQVGAIMPSINSGSHVNFLKM